MKSFTPGELEVMEVLWKHGSLKPSEILSLLDRSLTNSALRSVLRVLMEKGHLTRQKKGIAYYYHTKRNAPTAFKKMTNRMTDVFCGGSSFDFIAQLIKTEELSVDEIKQLQALAKEKVSQVKSQNKNKGK